MIRFLSRPSEKDWERQLQAGIQAEREGRTDEARTAFEAALNIASEMGEDDPRRSRTLSLVGEFYGQIGLPQESRRCFDELLKITERAVGPDDPAVARVLSQMGSAAETQGSLGRAEQLYRRAMRIFENTVGADHRRTGMMAASLANVLRLQEQWSEATPLYLQAIEIERKVGGGDVATLLRLYLELCDVHAAMGREQQLEEVYLSAADLLSRASGRDQLGMIAILNRLGNFYLHRNRLEDAETQFARILDTQKKVLSASHPAVAFTLIRLGEIAEQQKRLAEAEDDFTDAAAILRDGNSHTEKIKHAALLADIARLKAERGQLDEAVEDYQEAIQESRATLPGCHPNMGTPLTGLALVYERQKRFDEAEAQALEALATCQHMGEYRHPNQAQLLDLLARLAENRKDWPTAQQYLVQLTGLDSGDELRAVLLSGNRLRRLAEALLQMGLHREARETIEKAIGLLRYHPEYSRSPDLTEMEAVRKRIVTAPAK